MKLAIILWIIAICGFIMKNKNFIILMICLELILLAVSLNVVIDSIYLDDLIGQIYGIYIISLAGAESAIGLAILISYFRLRGSISLID